MGPCWLSILYLILCCIEEALHGMMITLLLRGAAHFDMKLLKKQCDLKGKKEIREGRGREKEDQENVETVSDDFRNFKVFLLVLNLLSSSMHINFLLGGCRHYVTQAIYQNPCV